MRSALRSGVAPGGKPPAASRRGDRQRRIARLTAARGAGLGLPRRNRCFREPDGQASTLAQGNVIGSPVSHSVPLLRDVTPAILVGFEWHDDDPRSGTGSQIYRPLLAANDRSVQQGEVAPFSWGVGELG